MNKSPQQIQTGSSQALHLPLSYEYIQQNRFA